LDFYDRLTPDAGFQRACPILNRDSVIHMCRLRALLATIEDWKEAHC
jgi:hypothetical protein